MLSPIQQNSPIPYYAQIKEALRQSIETGEWKPGDQLASEPDLCRTFGVSRIVIRQALNEMAYEGVVVRRKGKGTYVAEPKIVEGLVQELTGFHQDMTNRGYKPTTQVLGQAVVAATPAVAGHLRVDPGTPVVQLDRLRFVSGEPIVLVATCLPSRLVPGLETLELATSSLYALLEQRYGLVIARSHRTIGAVAANSREALLLQVEKGAPMIQLESVSYLADGTPLEYYQALHRADRSTFEVDLVRLPEQGRLTGTELSLSLRPPGRPGD
ncbi:MAG: GntR family transcriptional regulator [Anaerolineae bacterium]